MNEAEKAVANSLTLELKKDGLVQRQSGDWQLRFTVSALDMDQRLAAAPMGARFACVLVEIGDDEAPIDHLMEARDKWRDLGPAKQAGIRCKDPIFWAFLHEQMHYPKISDEDFAATLVREYCGVTSRSELAKPGMQAARLLWYQLDGIFQTWKVKEHA